MSNRKVTTVKIQGDTEYARVPERLKLFREDCPNGFIETTPTMLPDGQIMFKARVLKDKSEPQSGEATGHALGTNKGTKAFEKLETVAVGRALAMLGYLASGEVASFEEMEEYLKHKKEQKEIAIAGTIDNIQNSKTLDELKSVFVESGLLMTEAIVVEAKDKRKSELIEVS